MISRRLWVSACLLLSVQALAAGALTGSEVVLSLGALQESSRFNAIASLARGGKIQAPLTSDIATGILQGTTDGARAASIGELAPLLISDLSGRDAEAILGSPVVMSSTQRLNAITALARSRRFGPSMGEDAALLLDGLMQASRAGAIGEVAPFWRGGLSGKALATILGTGQSLSEDSRVAAIAAMVRTGKKPAVLSAADGAAILDGTTQQARAVAIAELARLFKADIVGQEAATLFGPETSLSETNRLNALVALARASRFGPSIGEDLAVALQGMTQARRASAIAELAPFLRSGLTARSLVTILGGATVLSEGDRYNAIVALANAGKLATNWSSVDLALATEGMSSSVRVAASTAISTSVSNASSMPAARSTGIASSPTPTTPAASGAPQPNLTAAMIDARIARLRNLAATRQEYLYASTGIWSDLSIVARDLPVALAGFTDYRALYDQVYFSADQYLELANRWIRKASAARMSGDLATASHCLDRATSSLQQRQSSYSASIAIHDQDLARATTYVKATYEASKWSAGILGKAIGVPGASVMIDVAADFIDFGLNVQDVGLKSALTQEASNVLTSVVLNRVPIPTLSGRSLSDAMKNRTGKLLANTGVIAELQTQLKDARVRKAVIDGAKALLSKPAESAIGAGFDLAVDRLIGVDPANF